MARDIQSLPDATAIIGRIPGYNQNIDTNNVFANELLKGITFIDLRPMTYQIGPAIANATGVSTYFQDLKEAIKQPGIFQRKGNASKDIFHSVLERMEKDFQLSKGFAKTDMIRIIGANDSTFTETFSNSYDGQNAIGEMFNSASNKVGDTMAGKAAQLALKGIKSYSHADMIQLAGGAAKGLNGATGSASISDIAAGALFGMNMAVPSVWQQSNYSSTLTLFIKLVSPVGTSECVKRNILEPILYLLAAASPLTYSGLMYGFPLLWDIQAHGITDFRLGGIAAMSLIRGSFETTFNHLLQPTVIDVRLTLVPVLNDFAVQTSSDAPSIYTNPDMLGVQNPSDIVRGVTNENIKGTSNPQVKVSEQQVTINTIKL